MRSYFVAGLFLIGCLVATASQAFANDTLAQFFGEFEGRSMQPHEEPRDLSVRIRPYDHGFTLDGTTVIDRSDGPKRQSYSIHFSPTNRTGIFASAMRRNMFGHSEPLDPLEGDPYIWARIAGGTLAVYALLITDDGYEMQINERTLTPDGMELRLSHDRNGKEMKIVTGTLRRIVQ
jgi:hypothetical protein